MQKNTIDISKTAQLYNERFLKHGHDIKTVGWGSAADQFLRFEMLFRGLDLKGKTILDVGCGLGDVVSYLKQSIGDDFNYLGIDIAENLINDATKTYGNDHITFLVGDIFSHELPKVDISILSGALSHKTEGIELYTFQTMEKMFELSKEAACLNFLSKYVDFELDKNQHYSPEVIFSQAKQISKKVCLFHDYPLYEFTVQIINN